MKRILIEKKIDISNIPEEYKIGLNTLGFCIGKNNNIRIKFKTLETFVSALIEVISSVETKESKRTTTQLNEQEVQSISTLCGA